MGGYAQSIFLLWGGSWANSLRNLQAGKCLEVHGCHRPGFFGARSSDLKSIITKYSSGMEKTVVYIDKEDGMSWLSWFLSIAIVLLLHCYAGYDATKAWNWAGNCGLLCHCHFQTSRPKEANDIKEILANEGGGRIGRVWLKDRTVPSIWLGRAQGFNDPMKLV